MIGLPLWTKIAGSLVLAAALILPWKVAAHWKGKAADYALIASQRKQVIETFVQIISRVSGNPKLKEEGAIRQLEELGIRLQSYRQEAMTCSASIDRLAAEGAKRQREADAALSKALNRRAEAENAVRRLEASARDSGSGQCTSPELDRRWPKR